MFFRYNFEGGSIKRTLVFFLFSMLKLFCTLKSRKFEACCRKRLNSWFNFSRKCQKRHLQLIFANLGCRTFTTVGSFLCMHQFSLLKAYTITCCYSPEICNVQLIQFCLSLDSLTSSIFFIQNHIKQRFTA